MTVADKKLHTDVVCTGCGLLCDDIFVEIEGGRMIRCVNACKRGRDKLQYYINEPGPLSVLLHPDKSGSKPITYEVALAESVKILKYAKHPLLYGFGSCSLEDQTVVADLAGKLNATITSPVLQCLDPLFSTAINQQYYTGTLSEAINKSDVFVFWNSDPIESHPRLLSKLIYTRGLFRITGYEVKKYVVVQPENLDKFRGTTLAVKIPVESELATLDALETAVMEKQPVTLPADVNKKDFDTLANLLKHGEYIIFFVDKRLRLSKDFQGTVSKLLHLIDTLNQKERAMILPLPEEMNSMGMFQHSIFTGRFPSVGLDWKGFDAILVGGLESTTEIPTDLINAAQKVPLIFLPQEEMQLSRSADVIIPVSAAGISSGGTAMRLDGVSLPLKSVIAPAGNAPTMAHVIQDLINHL